MAASLGTEGPAFGLEGRRSHLIWKSQCFFTSYRVDVERVNFHHSQRFIAQTSYAAKTDINVHILTINESKIPE
jgi:hypothetical protein